VLLVQEERLEQMALMAPQRLEQMGSLVVGAESFASPMKLFQKLLQQAPLAAP
jgi:hypothetical protein